MIPYGSPHIFLDVVRRPGTPRAEGPNGARVRGAKRNRAGRRSLFILPPVSRPGSKPLIGNFHMSFIEEEDTAAVRVTSRSIPPQWRLIRFRFALRTCAPWGERVARLTQSKNIPARIFNIAALFREQDDEAATKITFLYKLARGVAGR